MKLWQFRNRKNRFEDVLAECLAALETGETTVEACLSAHPRHADRLEPALRTAMRARRALSVQPDPAFSARLRAKVVEAASRQPVPLPVRRPEPRPAIGRPLWRPLVIGGAAAALFAGGLFPLAAVTSADALPGDWSYPIKRVVEQAQSVSPFADDESEWQLKLASKRAEEIAGLIAKGRLEFVPATSKEYQEALDKARQPLTRVESADPAKLRHFQDEVARQEAVLEAAVRRLDERNQQAPPVTVVPPTRSDSNTPVSPPGVATPAPVDNATTTPVAIATSTGSATPGGTATPTPTQAPVATPTPTSAVEAARSALNQATQAQQQASQALERARPSATPTAAPTATATVITPPPVRATTGTATATPSAIVTPLPTGTATATATTAGSATATSTAGASPSPVLTPPPFVVPTAPATRAVPPVEPPSPTITPPVASVAPPVTVEPTPIVVTPPSPVTPPVAPAPRSPQPAPVVTPVPEPVAPRPVVTPPPAPVTSTPTPSPTATPTPTATPSPTATPAATPTPTPTPTPAPPRVSPTPVAEPPPATATPGRSVSTSGGLRPEVIDLPPGSNALTYLGPDAAVDEALRLFAGRYRWVEWTAPGGLTIRYEPGRSAPIFVVKTGSRIAIMLSETVSLLPNSPFLIDVRAQP